MIDPSDVGRAKYLEVILTRQEIAMSQPSEFAEAPVAVERLDPAVRTDDGGGVGPRGDTTKVSI